MHHVFPKIKQVITQEIPDITDVLKPPSKSVITNLSVTETVDWNREVVEVLI